MCALISSFLHDFFDIVTYIPYSNDNNIYFWRGGGLLPLKYPRQNPFVGFTCIIAFQIILQQCCKTSCPFLLPVLRSLNHYSYKELVQVNDFNY